jgi:hypothetical protein
MVLPSVVGSMVYSTEISLGAFFPKASRRFEPHNVILCRRCLGF